MSIFLSKILNSHLVDNQDRKVGKLTDLLVEPGDNVLNINSLVLKVGGKSVTMDANSLNYRDLGVGIDGGFDQLQFDAVPADEIQLARDILDAQVIDINGAKVIRVNDIQLEKIEGRWVVLGLDIGVWGVCRRLGIANWLRIASDLFKFNVPEGIVPWKEVAPVVAGFRSLQLQVSSDQIERLHPADLADIVADLGHRERQQLLTNLTIEQTADLVEESDTSMQLAILQDLGDELAADVLEAMEPDEAADLLADVPAPERDRLMGKMDPEEAEGVRSLMQWDEGTAGAIMNIDYWSIPSTLTKVEALAYFRSGIPLCEGVLHVYVLDREERLEGVLHLRPLLAAPDHTPVRDLMEDDHETVGPEESIEDVRRKMVRYQLLAMPVVETDGTLLGVVTINDMLEVLFDDE